MKSLIGYSDRLSVRPGEIVGFKISADGREQYSAQLVRLICGGAPSGWPPFKEVEIPASINGNYSGRRQRITPGSFISVENVDPLSLHRDFTILITFMPTAPGAGRQHLISRWEDRKQAGWTLHLTPESRLAFSCGPGESSTVVADGLITPKSWYRAIVRVTPSRDSTELVCHLHSAATPFHSPMSVRGLGSGFKTASPPAQIPLLLAAAVKERGTDTSIVPVDCFDGRLESPVIYQGSLTDAEVASVFAGERPQSLSHRLLADWDFSREMGSNAILDCSPNGLHGKTHNLPLRAVKGSRWDGSATSWTLQPHGYAAIHFHRDDLYDCGWSTDITYQVDADLNSGVYALRLRQGAEEEYLPFFVAPPKHKPRSKLAFLVPTYTYLAYGNLRVLGSHEAMRRAKTESGLTDEAFAATLMTGPGSEQYVRELEPNQVLGLSTYDHHSDGSPVHFSSLLRPLLNMRPKTILWTFCADLLIIDWLEAAGFDFDVITDELLHAEGVRLLRDYSVVMTGNHPEYNTSEQLDAIRSYLSDGGRLMYMGGNGFYWKIAIDDAIPGAIEVRRGRGSTQTWVSDVGEQYFSFGGELGGLWRDIGRAPQQLFGVGFIAQGSSSSYYRVVPGVRESRAAFALEGVADEIIGDFGCFGGAAGQEIDRTSAVYGTPPHTIILARSETHGSHMLYVIEEMLGEFPTPELYRSKVAAETVFFETPRGGAVFAVGSMAWCGSLAHDGYKNNIARITSNVLRRFLNAEGFEFDPWA